MPKHRCVWLKITLDQHILSILGKRSTSGICQSRSGILFLPLFGVFKRTIIKTRMYQYLKMQTKIMRRHNVLKKLIELRYVNDLKINKLFYLNCFLSTYMPLLTHFMQQDERNLTGQECDNASVASNTDAFNTQEQGNTCMY